MRLYIVGGGQVKYVHIGDVHGDPEMFVNISHSIKFNRGTSVCV